MRTLSTLVGAFLVSLGLAGIVMLGAGPRHGLQLQLSRAAARFGLVAAHVEPVRTPLSAEEVAQLAPIAPVPADGAPAAAPARPAVPPARVLIPRIRLDTEVVSARLVKMGDAITWEVPAFRVGHAQGTAGVGGGGNMVLLGHVSSLNAGNVFQDLDRVGAGDEIVVHASDGSPVTYRVQDVRRVDRDDASVIAQGDQPVVTLITCTGTWLPQLGDYSHRLVVRAARA